MLSGSCFSLEYVEHICILIVLIVAAIAIIRIFIPMLIGTVGVAIPAPIVQLFSILLWAAVVIVGIVLCFDLFRCLIGAVRF